MIEYININRIILLIVDKIIFRCLQNLILQQIIKNIIARRVYVSFNLILIFFTDGKTRQANKLVLFSIVEYNTMDDSRRETLYEYNNKNKTHTKGIFFSHCDNCIGR